MAFQYFADEAVDIALIETGMGGRWDATNVVIPLVSVITHIDIDHTHFLGDTLAAIASEKAGIIKPGRPALSAPQPAEVMAVLGHVDEVDSLVTVEKIGSPQKLKIETHSRNLPPINLPLLGECQRENCAVVVATVEILADLLGFEPEFKKGLESVEWGARFQILETDPVVILDGAHNPSAARALARTLKETYPRYQVGFILGFLDDKDTVGFLRAIKSLATQVWTVPIDAPRGATAEQSASQAQLVGIDPVPGSISSGLNAAREWASAEPNRLVCITGSLFLAEALN